MAAAKKVTGKKAKKTAKKEKSGYHALRAIKETRANWIETFKDYNDKYLIKPFETGKDFAGDLQKDPLKTIEDMVDNGKSFVQDLRREPRKAFNGFVEDGRGFFEEVKNDLGRAKDNLFDGSKDLYKGLQKDTSEAFEGLVKKGKNMTEENAVFSSVEKHITKGLESVPDRLNLPNKKEMDKLAKTVGTLNRKINALSKAQAA